MFKFDGQTITGVSGQFDHEHKTWEGGGGGNKNASSQNFKQILTSFAYSALFVTASKIQKNIFFNLQMLPEEKKKKKKSGRGIKHLQTNQHKYNTNFLVPMIPYLCQIS